MLKNNKYICNNAGKVKVFGLFSAFFSILMGGGGMLIASISSPAAPVPPRAEASPHAWR